MPVTGAKAPSWTDGVQVAEKRLQEYLCQKQHTVQLKGAAEVMSHTLEPAPTTTALDGFVHFGDTLMLRNACTEGLLLTDISDQIDVAEGSRSGVSGVSLSTAKMIKACPRNVFTISRVNDSDSFGRSVYVHFGQALRLSTASDQLSDRPLYLFGSSGKGDDVCEADGETLVCLYPRASSSTHWEAVREENSTARATSNSETKDVIALGASFRLRNRTTGAFLASENVVRMNTYGNELRVFGSLSVEQPVERRSCASNACPSTSAGIDDASMSVSWSFVNSIWAERVVEEARSGSFGAEGVALVNSGIVKANARCSCDGDGATEARAIVVDHGEVLRNPVYRAEAELRALEVDGGAAAFAVVARVYPILRDAGMHVVRNLRRMCVAADGCSTGVLPVRVFEGLLSWVAIRLRGAELRQLLTLFQTDSESEDVDYRRFFALMSPRMPEVRDNVVRDAYTKLQGLGVAGFVEAQQLQRHWNPRCHPRVQCGSISEAEALNDFLKQWEVTSADGTISFDKFSEYYRDVSIAVESDEVFVEIVRCGWKL